MNNRAQQPTRQADRLTQWLSTGGIVLASNERATRALIAAYNLDQQSAGRKAWPAPAIHSWETWLRDQWSERNHAGWMLLNPLQEQALWARVIRDSPGVSRGMQPAKLAETSQRGLQLLADFAPQSLSHPNSRAGWAEDASIFHQWLTAFENLCRKNEVISASLLSRQLSAELARETGRQRPPLLLMGFDRLLATQTQLLNHWGTWETAASGQQAETAQYLAATDQAAEMAACVHWLRLSLTRNPNARLMLVTPNLQQRRGELERALLQFPELPFEFSLGVPLGQLGLIRSAILLLRWLREPLTEHELDWLISSGYWAAITHEKIVLAEQMLTTRRRGRERLDWLPEDLTVEFASSDQVPPDCLSRFSNARTALDTAKPNQPPMEWAALTTELLTLVGWPPGQRSIDSTTFQAQKRWERVLETCGSLGYDGTQMEWAEFLVTLTQAVTDTIFALESTHAPVQITEPIEAAGQTADGIWFLGADEDSWPGQGQSHPLLPLGLQRETGMPHASAQADWELAQSTTLRLLTSAPEVNFSFAQHLGELQARPSRLVTQSFGHPTLLAVPHFEANPPEATEAYEDWSQIPFPNGKVRGGAAALASQAQCPFQAFAQARLNATHWQSAQAGLNPKQRGQLLHSVLHRVWAGKASGGASRPSEIPESNQLQPWVANHVQNAVREAFLPGQLGQVQPDGLPSRFPARLLHLEELRLTNLVRAWLEFERQRHPFTVLETEAKREVTISGLRLNLRLDRLDQLQDGSQLVIDYKTGIVGPASWEGDRPGDVQLPLYATFAVEGHLEGLVFARVRAGDIGFYGKLRNAQSTLLPNISPKKSLVTQPLSDLQLEDWHTLIQKLAADFLQGRSEVDPKDPIKTCGNCHLHAVCRIQENLPLTTLIAAAEALEAQPEEAGDNA